MAPIATYVFLDLGTTGLLETNPDITELHMIAIKCENLRKYFREGGEEHCAARPRECVLHCQISDEDGIMWYTGDKYRDPEECILKDEIVDFLDGLPKPVCLIAHNGPKFDFPLLQQELSTLKRFSTKGIFCADSMAAFYDILEPKSERTSYVERRNGSFPWPNYFNKKSYRLEDVCKRALGFQPDLNNAVDRNRALRDIALSLSFEFMLWVAENKSPFTIGL